MVTNSINKCQYWVTAEPFICEYWNESTTTCTYKFQNDSNLNAAYAPYCNLLGTAISCIQYKSTSPGNAYARCVLPDPRRHVCNRTTGHKWVTSSTTDSGIVEDSYEIFDWDFDAINGYNAGACDGTGTDTTCSGYGAHHLGFGVLQPSKEENIYDIFKEGRFSTAEEFGYRLPTNFVVYNTRVKLSKCFWWKASAGQFSVNVETGKVELSGAWACSNSNDTSGYSEFTLENGPPCNGCKPECPYYTGICWAYCIDEKMESGDPILAEQVHELRYYCRENQWTESKLKEYFFSDGNIYTWAASSSSPLVGKLTYALDINGRIQEYQIPSYRTWLENFRYLDVSQVHFVMSEGTEVVNVLENYPSLIREVELISLAPIIKNQFAGTDQDIFETKYLSDKNTDVLIYGKTFSSAYTYAINISEIEAHSVLPNQLFEYDHMLDFQLTVGQQKYAEVSTSIIAILECMMQVSADKIISSLLTTDIDDFIFKVPTFYSNNIYNNTNENIIMVFQIIGEQFVYSKTNFKKELVAGKLIQTEFSIEGDNLPVRDCYDYTKAFYGHINNNNSISFKFVPIRQGNTSHIHSSFNYVYNDLYKAELVNPTTDPPAKPTVHIGHTLYKHTENEYILMNPVTLQRRNIIPLGSAGYLLLDLDHEYLNSVFKPWETNNITIHYSASQNIAELEIVYSGSEDGLGLQQIIVKHKNDIEIESVCVDDFIIFEELVFWEKRSYGQEPVDSGIVEIDESEDVIWDKGSSVGEISISDSEFNITDFKFDMVPSVVIHNCEGKPFTQFRTKPIGWVKQPRCPDVEINYAWGANYNEFTNTPVCACCGNFKMIDPVPSYSIYSPLCGDHARGSFSGKGAMWWPYTACDSYAQYEINNNLSNYSIDVIGLFKQTVPEGEPGAGQKIHGDHDMRMLGPANYKARHGIGCNFVRACSCDWRTYNSKKVGDNIFIGYARYRGTVDNATLSLWQETADALPKFGNVNRAQLDTYRTIDTWQYLKSTDGGQTWSVDSMLMPAAMMFNKADFTDDVSGDQMWDFGASSEGPPVVNPLGLYTSNNLDNISLNEEIDYDNRFDFDDVFNCRSTVDLINYPATVGEYINTKEYSRIYPWYEFKRYPVLASEEFIQWAWQEYWKPLERNNNSNTEGYLFKEFVQDWLDTDLGNIKGPFVGESSPYGMFKFLEITHPNYKYGYKNREFKTTITEGWHTMTFEAPVKNEAGEYEGYFGITLDEGPLRGFDWQGEWLTSSSFSEAEEDYDENLAYYNIELYERCFDNVIDDTKRWIEDVTLFMDAVFEEGKDMEQEAEDEGRDIERYEDEDVKHHLYYQYGLFVEVLTSLFTGQNLPLQVIPISGVDVAVTAPPTLDYPIEAICDTTLYEELICTFPYIKTISKISLNFVFGAELLGLKSYKYYHIPQITIYVSDDGTSTGAVEVFRTDGMELYTGESTDAPDVVFREYEWFNDISYIAEGKLGLYIKFRITPTDEELTALSDAVLARYDSSVNLISGQNLTISEETLVNAVENIYTYERKYYVSHGTSGDAPPQGVDETSPVLQPKANHRSTLYQKRGRGGVTGIPNSDKDFEMTSKVSGAYLYEIHEDAENIDEDLSELESRQKEIFDLAISQNPEAVFLTTVKSPDKFLDTFNLSMEIGINNSLINTLVSPLATINSFDMMSGEGHQYLPGPFQKAYCGRKNYCAVNADDVFAYEFINMDPEATNQYTGTMGSPLQLFYMGTKYMLDRITLNESLRSGVFGPKYGASSANQIWKDEVISNYLFWILTTFISDPISSNPEVAYNYLLFLMQGNWHNAFFGVSNYVET